MKKNLFLVLVFASITLLSFGGTFQIRATEGGEGYLYIQMQETSGLGTPQTSNQLTDIVFQVKWLQSLGNVDMGDVLCTNYEITKSGTRSTQGSYYYQEYFADNTPFSFPENWVQNTWVTIAMLEVSTGSGSGIFEVGEDLFVPTGVNIGVDLTDYTPSVNGSAAGYTYPTIEYNYVWVGGNGFGTTNKTKWESDGNWSGTCPGDALPGGMYPYIGLADAYIIIPSGLSYYPENTTGSDDGGWACEKMFIESGAHVTVPDLAGSTSNTRLYIDGDLRVDGTLNLPALGYATVTGSTTINSATGIVVQADATGIGSFINNGTITYGASGTAKVQTYLSNSVAGDWYIHLIGPTVNEENYTGSGTGAFLDAFNLVNGNTWAYEWDETVVNTLGSEPWINLFSLTDEIYTGKGIGIATDDNTNHTLEMTGALITGDKSPPALTYSENHNELISNPYPSAIDFDAFYANSGNSSVIQQKNWVWDATAGTYLARTVTGGVQYIQVGQAFFVETLGAGTVSFKNSNRVHSNEAFRNVIPNVLTVNVFGGQENYRDEMIVMFNEEATSGYDIEIEAMKWNSQYDDATQIKTIAEDNTALAINVLPSESLNNGMTSVPMHFNCGYNTEYTLSFFDMETFESGSEIWLEDKLIGGDWISINENPDYSFSATPNDSEDRFILHFFGPTSVDEFGIENTIDIYGYRQYAFVRNNTNEVIKEVRIFTLAGELLRDIETVDNKINKYWVSDKLGYYVVRVITDKNVYTNKVFISK